MLRCKAPAQSFCLFPSSEVSPLSAKMNRRTFLSTAALSLAAARAQNVVEGQPAGPVGKSQPLPDNLVESLLIQRPAFKPSAPWQRAVDEWLKGHPWRPFQHTLGISGQERYFDHAGEVFFVLSLVKPDKLETSQAIRTALLPWLETFPPFAATGLSPVTGTPREPWQVPEALLYTAPRNARDLFGVYALWLFRERFGIDEAAWTKIAPAIQERVVKALSALKDFDPASTGKPAAAVRELNGNIAGLLAFLRLCPDSALMPAARSRLRASLQQRVACEVLNPQVWTPSDLSTKSLHTFMLPRWQNLVPELGAVLAKYTNGLAAQRVGLVRESMPAWWMARGDRLSGGENYTSPLHVSRALFSAAALIECLPPTDLSTMLDVPWCRGDLSWMERAALCGGPL